MSHHRCDACGESEYTGSSNIEPLHHVAIDLCGGIFTELCTDCIKELSGKIKDLCLSMKDSKKNKWNEVDLELKRMLGSSN